MNSKLYQLLKGNVSAGNLKNILGSSLYNGLVSYKRYLQNEYLDLAGLLVKTLGAGAFDNKTFCHFIITHVLSDEQVSELAKAIRIRLTKAFDIREALKQKSAHFLKPHLLKFLDLDPQEFAFAEQHTPTENVSSLIEPSGRLSLHDYQKRIKNSIVRELLQTPRARMLVHMPTGSGKTKTSIEAIVDFLRTRPFDEGIVLWFAHSNELCQQAYETLVETWKSKGDFALPVFRYFGSHSTYKELLNYKKAVVFIGFQKFGALRKSAKSDNLNLLAYLSTNTQLVIIDEAHKSLAATYKASIDFVTSMPDCRLMGLTATPGRSNDPNDVGNKILSDYFNDNLVSITDENGKVVSNSLKYLQKQNYLAEIDHKPIEIDLKDFTEEELTTILRDRELDSDKIDKIVESPIRNKVIIDEIEKALADPEKDKILVFACTTMHCFLIQKLLEFANIQSEVVVAETNWHAREKHINDFKNGELKVLINYGVLTTGFDAPKLKTLVIARHTTSIILYSQMIGRALRGERNGGNRKNYVIDLIDNISILGKPDFLFSYWEEFWGRKYSK